MRRKPEGGDRSLYAQPEHWRCERHAGLDNAVSTSWNRTSKLNLALFPGRIPSAWIDQSSSVYLQLPCLLRCHCAYRQSPHGDPTVYLPVKFPAHEFRPRKRNRRRRSTRIDFDVVYVHNHPTVRLMATTFWFSEISPPLLILDIILDTRSPSLSLTTLVAHNPASTCFPSDSSPALRGTPRGRQPTVQECVST